MLFIDYENNILRLLFLSHKNNFVLPYSMNQPFFHYRSYMVDQVQHQNHFEDKSLP